MKKQLLVFIILFGYLASYAQESTLDIKIQKLKAEISQTEGLTKLKLLDSLFKTIGYNQDYPFDSIAKTTIDYAIELDSFNLAGKKLNDISRYYSLTSEFPETGLEVFKQYESLGSKLTDDDIARLFYIRGGDLYYFSGETKTSVELYEKAEQFALRLNDSSAYAEAKYFKATSLLDMGQFIKSSQELIKSVEIYRLVKDTIGMSYAKEGIAELYSYIGFEEEAKKITQEAMELCKLYKDYCQCIHPHLFDNAYQAELAGNQKLRIKRLKEYYHCGMQLKNGFPNKPLVIFQLFLAYTESDSLVKAKEYYDLIQEKYAFKDEIPYEAVYIDGLMAYFFAKKEYDKALIQAKRKLKIDIESEDFAGEYYTYEMMSKIFKAMNDYENAYIYNSKHIKLKDSLLSVKKTRILSYYQTLYETEKRDFQIASQKRKITILDQKNKIKQQWLLFGGLGLLAIFTIVYLVRSKRFVRSKQELQEKFSQDLLNEQEKERSRLARELHDSVGQKLMLLSKTTQKLGDENAEKLATNTLEEVRSISRGLHPSNLVRLGLTEAINALVYDINANTDLFFTDEVDNVDNVLPKDSELHLYRIIQETLSNIVKHAEAKAVKMNINKTSGNIHVTVSDNGKGFDFDSKFKSMSLGLKTLLERAKIMNAQINLNSNKGKGTILTLNIPI